MLSDNEIGVPLKHIFDEEECDHQASTKLFLK